MAAIILPTDFSDPALNAAAYALGLLGASDHTFHLLHAYLEPVPANAVLSGASDVLYGVSMEGMARFKERFTALPGAQGAAVQTHVRYGPLAPVVEDLCREQEAALVVMGTQGGGGLGLLGSNAAEVARGSAVPVLVVPAQARFAGLKQALFADDRRGVDPEAMAPLVELLRKHGADLMLAHIHQKHEDEPDPAIIEAYDRALAGVRHTHVAAMGGDVAATISEIATRNRAEMIAVLHRHLGLMPSLFHRSLTRKLAMHTNIPLLVLEHHAA